MTAAPTIFNVKTPRPRMLECVECDWSEHLEVACVANLSASALRRTASLAQTGPAT